MNDSTGQPASFYQRVGGEEGTRALVDRFYDLMDTLPEARTVRAMHATSLAVSRQKLFEFLSGWLGGPPLYIEKYGHPRLRARHLPFAIDTAARDAWLLCMHRALDELVTDVDARDKLKGGLADLADHMRNTEG
jgi:hemoglobin